MWITTIANFYWKANHIDKIFDFAGFTYTSNFFDSDYFKKLIVPFSDDKIVKSAEQVDLESTRIGINSSTKAITGQRSRGSGWWKNYIEQNNNLYLDRESGSVTDNGATLEFQDQLGSWNGGKYTCQEAGYYNIDFNGKMFPYIVHDNNKSNMEFKEGSFKYLYRLKKNGTILDASYNNSGLSGADGLVQEFSLSSGTHASPWIDLDKEQFFTCSAEDVYLNVGDVIQLDIGFEYPSSVKWYGTSDNKHKVGLVFKQSIDGNFTKFIVEPSSNQDMGNKPISMNQALPDKFKMKDFFMDIVRMFNLIIQDNPNKENDLIIEPRDDFFKSKQRVVDWTYKLDRSKQIEDKWIKSDLKRDVIFKYNKNRVVVLKRKGLLKGLDDLDEF